MAKNIDVHFSSKSNEWSTPQDFFDKLNEEFKFTLDPCASESNYKCEKYFTQAENGLEQSWEGETVFMNPPYSDIAKWVEKAFLESKKPNTIIVGLMPSRTDTKYFHKYIYNQAEIRFIKGRLKFGGSKNSAPFPSMIVVWKGNEQ